MKKTAFSLVIILTFCLSSMGQDLKEGFLNPPSDALPRVWWHWMNGNITKEGITADLEWMKRVCIGGMQLFDADLNTPQVVAKPINWMTPEYKDALGFAGAEAKRLGLEMSMASSGGWSITGGPSVKPEAAMKVIAWSEKVIEGPLSFTGVLPTPTQIYQGNPQDKPFFVDTKVLAFRVMDTTTMSWVARLNSDMPGRVSDVGHKAQYALSRPDAQRMPTPLANQNNVVDPLSVVDLTSRLKADGSLTWDVPAGKWMILRLGYTLTGSRNRAGSQASSGLEVDKLSRKHVLDYIENYLKLFSGKGFQYLLMDSWEAGNENWTEDMIAEFQKRRGYDPTPWLPVLTGVIVGSANLSDRFLWDFRRTLADMVSDNHYEAITQYVQSQGMKGVYAEAIGVEEPTTGDGLQAKSKVTIPMGEFVLEPWRLPGGRETNRADLREAASAAHIYAKGIAAAESFTTTETTPWAQSPYDLKPYADWAMAQGINQFVIHTSAHQPFVDDKHKPGITLGGAGQNYNRNNTWAEQSSAFNGYLARCSYLLQQGKFVADIAYYYGEDAPVVVPYWKAVEPAPPVGYDYDWLNTDVLLNRLTVQNHRLVLPDGMSYRLLVIPSDVTRLTLPVLRKLRELVASGATILGPHPGESPTLMGYPAADDSVRAIGNELWEGYGGIRRYHEATHREYGRGRIYMNLPVQGALDELNVQPDFLYTKQAVNDVLVWIHRRTDDTDIYFLANQRPQSMDFKAQFRVTGKEAELWNPDTGKMEAAGYISDSVMTTLALHLDPRGSVFVIFRKPAHLGSRASPLFSEKILTAIKGPWTLSFPENWGAPSSARMDSLISWTVSADAGIKYFSGTATYTKNIEAPASWFTGHAQLFLYLGNVKEIAEVSVNGKALGILWKPPFRTDISGLLKPGHNQLQIKVTNLWPNRMIGDLQTGVSKRYTFAVIQPFEKESPLMESGLLGPVKIISITKK